MRKKINPTRALSVDAQFFFEHAGFSHGPEGQSEGATRCAENLAENEALFMQACKLADVGAEWSDDPEGYLQWRADLKAGHLASKKKPDSIEQCIIWHREESGDVKYLASLHCIQEPEASYKRVVRAELATECADALRAIIAKAA